MNPWMERRVIGFAHQGGADEGPSNTIPAMRTAIANGIHALETDAHLTHDNQLVLHHDAEVVVGATTLAIATSTLAELRRVKPDLATLEEVLAAFPGVPMTVELKSREPDAVSHIARVLSAEAATRPLIVTSFTAANVAALRREAPDLGTAPAWPTIVAFWALTRLRLPASGHGHVALQVSLRFDQVSVVKRIPLVRNLRVATPRFVKAAHRRGLAVHVWTLDEEQEMEEALATGSDGIMTNRPSVLMRVLREKGVSWPG